MMNSYRRIKMKTMLKTAAVALLAPTAALGLYLGFLQFSGNFHAVIPGEFYRSAQPTTDRLETYVNHYGIRTVINLRGANESAAWYRNEVATAKKMGVNHVDFGMSSSSPFDSATADRLIEIMKEAPKPILIHCQAGADRSGIVSAIYSRAIAGKSEDKAERQLSLAFGHVGIPYLSATYAMDESWEKLEKHLAVKG